MYCMYCGNLIPDESVYCKFCGKKISNPDATEMSDCEEESYIEDFSDDIEIDDDISEEDDFLNDIDFGALLSGSKDSVFDEEDEEVEYEEDYAFKHMERGSKIALCLLFVLYIIVVAFLTYHFFYWLEYN